MISEFLWLELIEESEYSIHCSCNLPNPDFYDDEEMIQCGDVFYNFAPQMDAPIISINLFDNLKELCVGDTYQRKDFVEMIIFSLKMNYGVAYADPHIELKDCWGIYSGNLNSIDSIIRSMD